MDKRELEIILYDQKEELELKKSQRFIHRDAENRIELNSPLAQVVIGVRRSGKSTLCYNALMKSKVNFGYVNLDDERLIYLEGKDLNDLLEVLYLVYGDFNYLFIDEIQNIPEWYLFVNRLLRRGMHLIITGSNAKLLSGELATHLTGRHHAITLYPFSFKEFCEFKNVDLRSMSTKAIALRRSAFDEYMKFGGFPEMLFINDRKDYVINLVESILRRDIMQRFKIRHKSAFENLANSLLNDCPCQIVGKRLMNSFGFKSAHTVENYVGYIQQAYLLIGLHKFSYKSRLRLVGKKVYPVDVSLMNQRADAFNGLNYGPRLESIVYLDLLRIYKPRGYDIFYYLERGFECDFLVCKDKRVELAIQVSYDISSEKTYKREIKGLLEAARKTNAERLLLLTDHEYRDVTVEGKEITIRPVYDYFLS